MGGPRQKNAVCGHLHTAFALLLRAFAVPSITASLVGQLYNIVGQVFIGQSVGYLENAPQ